MGAEVSNGNDSGKVHESTTNFADHNRRASCYSVCDERRLEEGALLAVRSWIDYNSNVLSGYYE